MTNIDANINWFEVNRKYLTARVDYLKYLLRTSYPQFASERTSEKTLEFEKKIEKLRSSVPGYLPVEFLGKLFQLSEFEINLLLMTIAGHLDSSFFKPFGDEKPVKPNFSLAMAILPDPDWDVFTPQAALRRYGLIHLQTPDALTSSEITVPESIIHFIIGVETHDREVLRTSIEGEAASAVDFDNERKAEKICSIWTSLEDITGVFFTLTGEDNDIKKDMACEVAKKMNLKLRILPSFFIPSDKVELQRFILMWNREILLKEYLLYLDCSEETEGDSERIRMVDFFIDRLSWPVVCSSSGRRTGASKEQFSFEVKKPSAADQIGYWEKLLGSEYSGEIAEICSHFDLSFKDVKTCTKELVHSPDVELWEICRKACQVKIGSLATKIEPAPASLDLVLPPREKEILDDIVQQVKHRSAVYHKWGLMNSSSRGQGITALFAGASGTGKTTAAEYLALKLNLDLYRIDLSCIVSKYIGETEKNLQKIFLAAERSGAILLFDEADALFGKRTQVQDSHDRHANLEVSYLLQRMESFRGLAILTSNFRDSFDRAFVRRLKFIVQFPFPSAAERESIWKAVLPELVPCEGIDFKKLSQLNVAGGNILNITVNACFAAAADSQKLEMKHYLKAARDEYSKLEKTISEIEVRGWM